MVNCWQRSSSLLGWGRNPPRGTINQSQKAAGVLTPAVLGCWALPRHCPGIRLRQWLPYACFTGHNKCSSLGWAGRFGCFWPRLFPQSGWLSTVPKSHSPAWITQVLLQGLWIFIRKKKSVLGLVFSGILCPHPISRSREMWDGCNCHADHEEDRPTGSAPCQLYTAPLHFLSLQIPCLHACHLRQQVGTSANVSVSKHRSGWNVIVQSLWLASLFFSACS